jgi:hypothetical protein
MLVDDLIEIAADFLGGEIGDFYAAVCELGKRNRHESLLDFAGGIEFSGRAGLFPANTGEAHDDHCGDGWYKGAPEQVLTAHISGQLPLFSPEGGSLAGGFRMLHRTSFAVLNCQQKRTWRR